MRRLPAPRAVLLALGAVVALAGVTTACSGSEGPAADGSSAAAAVAARDDAFACTDADAGTWRAAPGPDDLADQVVEGTIPDPRDATADAGHPASSAHYDSAASFVAQSNVPDRAARQQVLEDAGFRDGAGASYAKPGRPYDVQVLTFADAAGAARYFDARLPQLCTGGGVDQVVPIDADGGIAWADSQGAYHGEFVLGPSLVSLALCRCDDQAGVDAVAAWAAGWRQRFATGDPQPVG